MTNVYARLMAIFFSCRAEREININRSLTDGKEQERARERERERGLNENVSSPICGAQRTRKAGSDLSDSVLSFLPLISFLFLSLSFILFLLLIVFRTQLSDRECRRDVNACKILAAFWSPCRGSLYFVCSAGLNYQN